MRNGNDIELPEYEKNFAGSYRTYEEWKLHLSIENVNTFLQVLTVPMRNGNATSQSFDDPVYEFLPYL